MSTNDIPLEALTNASVQMANIYMQQHLDQQDIEKINKALQTTLKSDLDALMKAGQAAPAGVDPVEHAHKAALKSLEVLLKGAAHVKGRDHVLKNINPGMKSEPFRAAFRKYGAEGLADLLNDAPKADRRRSISRRRAPAMPRP